MGNNNEHLKNLAHIRSLMENSTRFISLSGLSGVAAGVFALIGAAMVYIYSGTSPLNIKRPYYIPSPNYEKWGMDYITFFLVDAASVVILAVVFGYYFTSKKASNRGQKIWTKASKKLLLNFLIPLVTGGLFCLILIKNGYFGLVAPSMLIFYGLSCINASKYTLDDIRYLGFTEIALGLAATYFIGSGLFFWAIGFGVMHILYGIRMYLKYDK